MSIDNDGKELEEKVRDAAALLLGNKTGMLVRLHDSKSAGKYLPPVAGDFMGNIRGLPVLLECKSSVEGKSLTEYKISDFMRPTQVGSMILWERVGGAYILMFYSFIADKTEFYLGWQVEACVDKDKLKKPAICIDGKHPHEIAQALGYMVDNILTGTRR